MTASAPNVLESAATFVTCNLCGADDAETLFEAGQAQINRIVKCRQCGLMYSNPRIRPVDQELVKDYDPQLTKDAEEYDPARFEKERVQVRDYRDTLKYLAELYPNRGRLLELGCGMGFLLKALSDDGWDVLGIEPDRGFCQYVELKHGLKALPTLLEDSGHTDEPIRRVLKPGGLLVLEAHRYDSLMFKLLRHRERSVSCDGHIYFFTTETLRKLCEKAGLQSRQIRYVGRSLNLDKLAYNIGVMTKNEPILNGLLMLSRKLGFRKIHV